MNRKPKLKLPEDCSKLAVSACTAQKIGGKCKVRRGFLGFGDTCVANENYESDKFILEKGFKNFARIDEDNLEEELEKRDQVCKKLSKGSCDSLAAREIGCSYKYSLLGKSECGLSNEIVKFFYRKRKDCVAKDCDKKRRKYSNLCEEHYQEINEILAEYKSYYTDIITGKDTKKDNLLYFNDLYEYMLDVYPVYLLDKPNILDSIEEMKTRVDIYIGKDQCQAYNITSCKGKGQQNRRCQYKGYIGKEGTFCRIHSGCYDSKIKKYKYLRDNFEELCKKEVCKSKLSETRQLWDMIRFTTDGEASKIKYEILEIIEIIEEYDNL